jgi:ankyrin repeat protein
MSQAKSFFLAVKAGNLSQVKILLRAEPALASAVGEDGVSAILLAVYHGRREIVNALLALDPELNIWEACAVGQHDRVVELLDRFPALVNAFAPDGFTPLGLAVFFGHPSVAETLVTRGAAINLPARNAMKVCPLHSAAAHHDPAVALALTRRLLEKGAAPNVVQTGGWTPLHEAARRGHPGLVSALLEAGAQADAPNDEGKTPLDLALASGHAEVIRLLERG